MAPRRAPDVLSATSEEWRHITPNATEEIKPDGYRMVAVRGAKSEIYSRLKNSTTKKFPQIAEALKFPQIAEALKFPQIAEALDSLPEGTVIDGELVALNAEGKPDFNLMQNYKSAEFLVYFVFDILMHEGQSLDADEDLMSAMARELVERVGVGHSADAVWAELKHQRAVSMPSIQSDTPSPIRNRSSQGPGPSVSRYTGVARIGARAFCEREQ